MLLKTFVMGGPLLHCFWTLCSNFCVKRGGGGGGGGGARGGGGGGGARGGLDTWWALDTYTMVPVHASL